MPGEFDMRRMQEEAARRAREMQARARVPQPRRGPGEPPRQEAPKEKPPKEEPPKAPPPAPEPPALQGEGAGSMLGNLFQDKEKTIILALLILLGSEEGSQELMFALLFLLM